MRVLWLSTTKGLFNSSDSHFYNGCGWVSSLQKLVENSDEIDLGVGFLTTERHEIQQQGRTKYYPILKPNLSAVKKLIYYYKGYKQYTSLKYLPQLQHIISDFNPDIIHVFGLENPLAVIVGETQIPQIVHLQGLLLPCDNAFYPPGINRYSFIWPPSLREWIFRNGFIYAKKNIHIRALHEHDLFLSAKFYMGRTIWDRQMTNLLSPRSSYFHVDEVLRDTFYEKSGSWKPTKGKFIITSTLSENVYKGLDVVLKTAKLLKELVNFDFEWHIIGISQISKLVKFFERSTKIESGNVNIIYEGVKDESVLCNILLSSNVYVHPSYIDNSPNSLCEAQMLGVPVIGSYVGGIPSLIANNITGFLYPANDIHNLASILINLHDDKELVTRISKHGSEVATKRHDRDIILSNLLKTYKTISLGNKLQQN